MIVTLCDEMMEKNPAGGEAGVEPKTLLRKRKTTKNTLLI